MKNNTLGHALGLVTLALFAAACSNPIHEASKKTVSPGDLAGITSYADLVEGRGYMSGSVLWNAAPAGITHLKSGIVVGVRVSNVAKTDVPAEYAAIKINACTAESVTFTYYPFSTAGGLPLPNETFTVKTYTGDIGGLQNAAAEYRADVNHDGVADIAWTPPVSFRPNLNTSSRYLTFVTAETAPPGGIESAEVTTTHTAMFSVIESQYKGGQYPGGLTGINPSGAWIYNLRQMKNGFHMNSGKGLSSVAVADTELEVRKPGQTPAQATGLLHNVSARVVGSDHEGSWEVVEKPAGGVQAARMTGIALLVKGDYVIDNLTGDYYYYKGGPNPGTVNPANTTHWEKLSTPATTEAPADASAVAFAGNDAAIDSALAAGTGGAANVTPADLPYFAASGGGENAAAEFVAFKRALKAAFTDGYTPAGGAPLDADTAGAAATAAFIDAAIHDAAFLDNLNAAALNTTGAAGSLDETGDPGASGYTAYRAFINRNILRSALATTGMHRYLLEAAANPADLSTAIPAASLVIRDPSAAAGAGMEPASAFSAARAITGLHPKYQQYLNDKASARGEFEKEFKVVIEKDLVKTVKDIILSKIEYDNTENIIPVNKREKFYESLNNMKTLVALGLAGGGQHYNGKIEATAGAAVFLQMEIDTDVEVTLPSLFGSSGLEIYTYNSVFSAGPVIIQVKLPIKFNMDLTVGVTQDVSSFAGYTGFYGGKATGGVNYGVGYKKICIWPWPKKYISIPWSLNITPYETHKTYNKTIAYAGFKNTFSGPITLDLAVQIKPYLAITPSFGVYGLIWAKLPAQAGLPLTVALKDNAEHLNTKLDLQFKVGFALGVGFSILCFDVEKGLYDKTIFDQTINIFNWDIY